MDARYPGDDQRRSRTGPGSAHRCASPAAPRLLAALAALAALATLALPRLCWADDAQEVELSKNRFDAGQYEEAHRRLTVLLDPSQPTCDRGPSGGCRVSDPDLIERARVLDAAALIALRRPSEAEAQIEKILRQNPTYAPNPMLFPQEVVDRFTEVRGRLRDELEKEIQRRAAQALRKRMAEQQLRGAEEKWITDLQKLASTKVEVHSRWIAALPLGIGQYQNGDVRLGAFFTATELLLGATTVTSALLVSYYGDLGFSHNCSGNCGALQQSITVATLVNRVAFSTLIGVTAFGIVQAELAFVPEHVTERARPIPPRPKIMPTISFTPGQAGIGLVGEF